jgi:hypothetical protein
MRTIFINLRPSGTSAQKPANIFKFKVVSGMQVYKAPQNDNVFVIHDHGNKIFHLFEGNGKTVNIHRELTQCIRIFLK